MDEGATERRLTLLLECGGGDAEALSQELTQHSLEKPMVSQRKGVAGDVAAWVLVCTAAIQVFPAILQLIGSRVGSGRVTKIKIGDIEIENPTRAQVEELMPMIKRLAAQKLALNKVGSSGESGEA